MQRRQRHAAKIQTRAATSTQALHLLLWRSLGWLLLLLLLLFSGGRSSLLLLRSSRCRGLHLFFCLRCLGLRRRGRRVLLGLFRSRFGSLLLVGFALCICCNLLRLVGSLLLLLLLLLFCGPFLLRHIVVGIPVTRQVVDFFAVFLVDVNRRCPFQFPETRKGPKHPHRISATFIAAHIGQQISHVHTQFPIGFLACAAEQTFELCSHSAAVRM
mmetsp:Transcript_110918/g.254213  ORF Transcript_110918/g.254213 Transcript_110918/m.254213 type:complete len:214 (-) Transcript_110918:365-1006(-)